jgi:DNA mismatch endonuclease (patch repair protein)
MKHNERIDPVRSVLMRSVRRTDTGAELIVRRLLHSLGLRFRLHREGLPGTPDIVLPSRNVVIFVHGCFWHRHIGCRRTTSPKTRMNFWNQKFDRNIERDKENRQELLELGWRVITVWECETRNSEGLRQRLAKTFKIKLERV